MDLKNLVQSKFDTLGEKVEISFKGMIKNFTFSSYLHIKPDSNKLFVILNGALLKEPRIPLTYHRYTWHEAFDGSVLYIADPTLFQYEAINLAWYLGDKELDIYPYLVDFVKSVAERLKIVSDHIIVYGSSGGGFSSLKLASLLGGGSLAVCINPQTVINKYFAPHVNLYFNTCFQYTEQQIAESSAHMRFNAIKMVQNHACKVLFIQNLQDTFHYQNHFIPFISALQVSPCSVNLPIQEQNTGRIRTIIYDHPSGHAAEPKEMLPEIMQAVEYMINNVKAWKNGVFIVGSCVTRDSFLPSMVADYYVVDYHPRTSFARLASGKVGHQPNLDKLKSPFQKKVVLYDVNKQLLNCLKTTQFDVIVMDFIDHRYDLVEYEPNCYVTYSYELQMADIIPKTARIIHSGSYEFYELWVEGFGLFVKTCQDLNLLDKIIINEVYWSTTFSDLSKIPNYSQEKIDRNNQILEKLYAIVKAQLPNAKFISYDKSIFLSDKNHKWGQTPFHYDGAFYKEFINKLNKIFSLPTKIYINSVNKQILSVEKIEVNAETDCICWDIEPYLADGGGYIVIVEYWVRANQKSLYDTLLSFSFKDIITGKTGNDIPKQSITNIPFSMDKRAGYFQYLPIYHAGKVNYGKIELLLDAGIEISKVRLVNWLVGRENQNQKVAFEKILLTVVKLSESDGLHESQHNTNID